MDVDRFMQKIHINSVTGCWEWQGARKGKGYGSFSVNGKKQRAHRVSYLLFRGAFDQALCVCHHCDNPICVNPEHLFLGTQADNVRDMLLKGREARFGRPGGVTLPVRVGSENFTAKLNEQTVAEIRSLFSTGQWTKNALACRYSVSKTTIRRVVTRKLWTHV